MSSSVLHTSCPRCGAAVPEDAPGDQCPRCLLGAVAAPTEPSAAAAARYAPREWPTLEEVRAAFPELEISGEIGRGGMAVVFRAVQPHLDRAVALKVMAPWLAAEPGFADRFSREGRALARLNHPNIVIIHDFGQSAGFYYLLMEHVDGVNLRQALDAGRFTPDQALALVPKVCDALQYAHGEGVLHRDIKPDNILLDAKGRVKIADFGVAKLAGESDIILPLTRSGMHLGTPAYMAPEQMERPGDVDHRADIYSLGVVFYEMLTGELPLGRFAPPSERSALDTRVDGIVFRALEKKRERRYQSAAEVKTSVQSLAEPAAPMPSSVPVKAPRGIRFGFAKPSAKASAGAAGSMLSLGAAVLLIHPVLPAILLDEPLHPEVGNGLIVPMLFTTPICIMFATAGVVLGFSGMRDIRHSGGHLRGMGRAAVAVLTWPVVITAAAVVWFLTSHIAWLRLFVSGGSPFFPGLPGQTPYMLTVLILSLAALVLSLGSAVAKRTVFRSRRFAADMTRVTLAAAAMVVLVPASFLAFRQVTRAGVARAGLIAPRGNFEPQPTLARVTVLEAKQTVTAGGPPGTGSAQQQFHMDITMEAALTANRRLECEVILRNPARRDGFSVLAPGSTVVTGDVAGGYQTSRNSFRFKFPQGAAAADVQAAHDQINRNWLQQDHGVFLGKPEPLFRVRLPDGSKFEAVFVLEDKEDSL